MKFQLEKTSNKKVIAKKPLTNLYEMNSSGYFEKFVVVNVMVYTARGWPQLYSV